MAKAKYQPDPRGLADLSTDQGFGDACINAAEAGRQFAANDDPKGTYTVSRALVPGGYSNELRAGALLEETTGYGEGDERRTLVRSVPIIENGA